jgi:hypothetical protein
MEERIPKDISRTFSRISALKMLFLLALICLALLGLPNYWPLVVVPSGLLLCYFIFKLGIQWITYWVKTLLGK